MALPLPRLRILSALGTALLLPSAFLSAAPNLAKTGGPETCAECHIDEVETWKMTKHFKTLNTMNRRPEALAILAKLGLKNNMKAEASCVDCHYTNKLVDGHSEVDAGISCESCHGAGLDWYKTHGDYGKGFTKETEPPAHRATRLAQAVAAGMLNPDNLYLVGANCYGCHILNDEKIANVGGHSVGSTGFDLLTWSQGEVRHTFLSHDYQSNAEAAPEHRRRLYVVGAILETEFSFRATARATEKANYGISNARRADAARKLLEKIQALAPTPELASIVATAKGAGLKLNNAAELNAAADRINALGQEFATKVTGDRLAAIDPLLPASAQYKGTPYTPAKPVGLGKP